MLLSICLKGRLNVIGVETYPGFYLKKNSDLGQVSQIFKRLLNSVTYWEKKIKELISESSWFLLPSRQFTLEVILNGESHERSLFFMLR